MEEIMLEDQISKDYVQAMKDRNKMASVTLGFLRAQLKNVHIDKKIDKLEDAEVISVIKKQIKQRQDSIEQFTAGKRQDLVDKEVAELAVLKKYLPEELSKEQVKAAVEEAVKQVGASSMKDMGAVMRIAIEKTQGKADNKVVSETVKEILSKL